MKAPFLAVAICAVLVSSCCPPFCGDEVKCNYKEDCIGFEPLKTRAELVDGSWRVVEGNMSMLAFGDKQDEAELSVRIIQFYKFDKQCFVGRPDASLKYWKVKSKAPSGAMPGEDCISFNPDNIVVKNVSGSWRIVEGTHSILDFGNKESEARTSLKIIKCNSFTNICYVGRPDASMIYFRK